TRWVFGHSPHVEELGPGRRLPAARRIGLAVAGHRVDAARGHLPAVEPAAPGRDHPDPAAAAEHHVAGTVKRGGADADPLPDRRAAVAGVPALAEPGDAVDVACGHLLAVEPAGPDRDHPGPVAIGDHQVAGPVHGHRAA